MTRQKTGLDIKSVQESAYEGETEVGEVVGKFIKRRKYYNISFQLEVFIWYEEMN